MLRLWAYLKLQRKTLGSSQFRQMCKREYINYLRVREWQDLVTQLRQMARDLKLPLNADAAPMSDVLTACLTGLLSNIGAIDPVEPAEVRRGRPRLREYNGTRGARFALSPGSVLAKHPPDLVMAVELIDTTRTWAHTVAGITAEQVEQAGAGLVTRTYSEPYFSTKSGVALVHEKLSLLGVPLVADRRVGYAAIDPAAARAIFIQSGLVEAGWQPKPGSAYRPVYDHNQATRQRVESLEDRARRRDLLVPDQVVADWFDARLPANVVSGATLERWLKADRRHAGLIALDQADLMAGAAGDPSDFPDVFTVGPSQFGLDYHFAPGEARDGLTVRLSLAQLAGLDSAPFTWGVVGQRLALVTELIRGLPKAVRTQFVPAPDWARRALDWLGKHDADTSQPITQELTRALRGLTGVTVTQWRPEALPTHLRVGFAVAGAGDEQYSRDLSALQADLGQQVRDRLQRSNPRPAQSGTTWLFGRLPPEVTLTEHGVTVTGYPGLKDDVTTVSEVLSPRLDEARRSHWRGLIRLALFGLPDPQRWLVAHLSNADKLVLASGPYQDVPALLADARYAAVAGLVDPAASWQVRDQVGFDDLVTMIRRQQVERTEAIVRLAVEALRQAGVVAGRLAEWPESALKTDLSHQFDNLIFAGFLHTIGSPWLDRLPVYLQAMAWRLEAAARDPVRDQARQRELDDLLDAYADFAEVRGDCDAVVQIGFLIEEWRIQLFAQPLRTRQPVSAQRIRQAMAAAAAS